VVVVGVGPSGRPSRLEALTVSNYETAPDPTSPEPRQHARLVQDTAVKLVWPTADQLVIEPVRGEPQITGAFTVVFP
jgi:hypothetical protein